MRINVVFADVQLHMHKQQLACSALRCTQLIRILMAALTLVHCLTPTLQRLYGPSSGQHFSKSPFLKKTPCFGGGVDRLVGCCSHSHPHILPTSSKLPTACSYGAILSAFVQIYAPNKGYLSSLQDSKLQDPEFHSHLQRQKLLMAHKI